MGFRLRRSARLGPRRFNDRYAGLRLFIDTPEAMEGHLLRAQGQDDARRRAQRGITAVHEATQLAAGRGGLA